MYRCQEMDPDVRHDQILDVPKIGISDMLSAVSLACSYFVYSS